MSLAIQGTKEANVAVSNVARLPLSKIGGALSSSW